MKISRAQALNFTISFALGGLFLWIALKDMQLGDFGKHMLGLDARWLLVYAGCHFILHWYRCMRIRILLRPLGGIGYYNCFVAGSVSGLALMALPFRLGDFVRPAMFKQQQGISFSSGLACVAVERIIDGIVVSLMLFTGLYISVPAGKVTPVVYNSALIAFAIFLGGLAFLIYAYLFPHHGRVAVEQTLGRVAPAAAAKISGMLLRFIAGLKILPDYRGLLQYLFETVVYWSVNAFSITTTFWACGMHPESPYAAGFVLLGLMVLGVMIPGAPAGIGPFEFFSIAGLGLYFAQDVVQGPGLAFVIINHGMTILFQVIFGVFFLVTGHFSLIKLVELAQAFATSDDSTAGRPEKTASLDFRLR